MPTRFRRPPLAACTLAAAALAGPLAGSAAATSSVVTSAADSGTGTLRAAITAANADVTADTIFFNIGGATTKIAPTSPLPAITEPVTIDAYTQPGASANTAATGSNAVLVVELSGENFDLEGGPVSGLTASGGSTKVKGLVFNQWPGPAISLGGGSNEVQGCFIGTDVTGTLDPSGAVLEEGVRVGGGANDLIGGATAAARNVISANSGFGVVAANATGTIVQGNMIGTTKSGQAELGNGAGGIEFNDTDDGRIGGQTAAARNVISGNFESGVTLVSGSTGNVVEGNFVGLNAAGTAGIGNGNGVHTDSADNTVGGSAAAARNVISGNSASGVSVGLGASGTVVAGNFVGTSAGGGAAIPNDRGVAIRNASANTIGGTDPGARNVISGNADEGIWLDGASNDVLGNFVGTAPSGTTALPNGGPGIRVSEDDNDIGDLFPAGRNVISGNGGDGIVVDDIQALNNRILGNRIGTGPGGLGALPNDGNGVTIQGGAAGTVIGGPTLIPGDGSGNVISGNRGSGVLVTGAGTFGNLIDGNKIGINADGDAAIPNESDGVSIQSGAANTIVGENARNIISGNEHSGVFISGAATTGTNMRGNFIGVDRTGSVAVPNHNGVEIANGAQGNRVGETSSLPNVISGNRFEGVLVHGPGTTHNVVVGNRIGAAATGSGSVPNNRGVAIAGGAQLNTVGGTTDSTRNVISANRTDGVAITGAGSNRNTVRGNFIGTSAGGTAARPNDVGVNVTAGAQLNTIGGATASARNVISGNTFAGVRVADAGTGANRIQGNFIGTGPGGTGPRPNGNGVIVTTGAQGTTVGGHEQRPRQHDRAQHRHRRAGRGLDHGRGGDRPQPDLRQRPAGHQPAAARRGGEPRHAERRRRSRHRPQPAPELPRDHGRERRGGLDDDQRDAEQRAVGELPRRRLPQPRRVRERLGGEGLRRGRHDGRGQRERRRDLERDRARRPEHRGAARRRDQARRAQHERAVEPARGGVSRSG